MATFLTHAGLVFAIIGYATKRKVAGSIPDEINFLIYLILPGFLPGVYSASNRNEYQKYNNNNVSGE
jgi:hypothetical protein